MTPFQFTIPMVPIPNLANVPNGQSRFASTLYHAGPPTYPYNRAPTPNMPPAPARPNTRFLRMLFEVIPKSNLNMPRLPREIQDDIISMITGNSNHVFPAKRGPAQPRAQSRSPAWAPPASGKSPFMALPAELRRQIFAGSLTDRMMVIQPMCDGKEVVTKSKQKDKNRKFDKNAHNIPNLMAICRKICEEITEVLYEERTFVIHVHEGLKTGGVEILNAGRQPLQYQDSTEDKRFRKFGHGEQFGFRRVKRIVVQIYPTTEDQDRHLALNTHFMNLALCRLLERPTSDRERITSIKIEFVPTTIPATDRSTRASIMRHEKPWMDVNRPKQSSIHNVSNIELLLRPFAMMTRCHRASINLPSYLAGDSHLSTFVRDLEQSMMSKTGTLMANDTLEHKIEQLRKEMEGHVVSLLYGNGNRVSVPKLADTEVVDDAGDDGDHDSNQDEGVELPLSADRRANMHPC